MKHCHAFSKNDARALSERAFDPRDPDPWLALYLDRSFPMDEGAKAALITDMSSASRQFLLPLVRPFARLCIGLNTLLKMLLPNAVSASKFLHRLISMGLKFFVTPEANYLILRHFHIGSEILAFVADNYPVDVTCSPLKPRNLDALKDEVFLKHDLNLYNFVIRLNQALAERSGSLSLPSPEELNYESITDGAFDLDPLPHGVFNVLDVQSAIEIYTPVYQLFLTRRDFWRAANSLQLDETIALYVAQLLRSPEHLALVNNKHPLVPSSTLRAGFRLMLHGLATEGLHAKLVQLKRAQAERTSVAGDSSK